MRKIVLFLFILFPFKCMGAAFLIYNQDAKANAMGMASVSSVTNESAIFFNPAMLVSQRGFGITINDTVIIPDLKFSSQSTGEIQARSKIHHLPSIYMRYSWDRYAFGVGIFSPFGLSTEWPRDWEGRYYATFSKIATHYFNPVFAVKLNDKISFGFGISYVLGSLSFNKALDLKPLPDGYSKLMGEGDGFGYNAALSLSLPGDYIFSVTYRSPVRIKYEGRGKVYLPVPLSSFTTDAQTRLILPFITSVGISKHINNLTLEFDILYTGWSSMKRYNIRSGNGLLDESVQKGWSNTVSLATGVSYRYNQSLDLGVGYMYDKTPVPTRTLGPELPDTTRNIFTFGMSYRKEDIEMNVSYQATFFKKVKSRLSGLSGTYKNFTHLILFGLRYD